MLLQCAHVVTCTSKRRVLWCDSTPLDNLEKRSKELSLVELDWCNAERVALEERELRQRIQCICNAQYGFLTAQLVQLILLSLKSKVVQHRRKADSSRVTLGQRIRLHLQMLQKYRRTFKVAHTNSGTGNQHAAALHSCPGSRTEQTLHMQQSNQQLGTLGRVT
jgi:hypothetical protein